MSEALTQSRDSALADRLWAHPRPNPVKIVREVAAKHGLSVEELTARSKRPPLAIARQEAMWELRKRTRLSFIQIAQRLGRADHSTAIHGVRAHERRRAEGATQ